MIFFYFHFCHFPLILNEQTALFFIYKKRFMPFPLRTAPVPKSSKIGFPWCQGPSAAHSQLSQECFQRGCWTLTNTAMHHPCPPPPPRCSPELRAGTEAPPSHESSTETCSTPLTLGATQRKQGTYFLTLEQAAILH